MVHVKNVLILLSLLLLCSCKNGTPVQTESQTVCSSEAESQKSYETEASEEESTPYNPQFYTGDKVKDSEVLSVDEIESSALDETEETSINDPDQGLIDSAKEYARCMYPDRRVDAAKGKKVTIQGKSYLMITLLEGKNTICSIAYGYADEVFYYYDAEVKLLIPIEYDEYGVRLVG